MFGESVRVCPRLQRKEPLLSGLRRRGRQFCAESGLDRKGWTDILPAAGAGPVG